MTHHAVFPYLPPHPGHGGHTLMPIVPIRLSAGRASIDVTALVDSGSMVNVLPLAVGLQLGLDWAKAPSAGPLSGNLASHPAKAVTLGGAIGPFQPVILALKWSADPGAPVLLGKIKFFLEFDVCFFRSRAEFHVQPRTP